MTANVPRARRRVLVAALAFVGAAGSLALVADLSSWRALLLLALCGALAAGEAGAQRADDCVDDADPLCLPSALSL
ncbi:MAG: hypothetical protein KC503_41985, partial [Myxococcales bacterium]|nr:hypothetical protein [Myxococcales bacterium]